MRSFLILLIVAGILYFGYVFLRKTFFPRWDLMICKNTLEDGIQCFDNEYVLKGYGSQRECMEKGIELAKNKVFECGMNCRDSKFGEGLAVCDVICNKGGCRE